MAYLKRGNSIVKGALDYEEGYHTITFTTGGGSLAANGSYNQLYYQKIGSRVWIQGYVLAAESSASGTLRASLPFAVADLNQRADFCASACLFEAGSNNADPRYGNWAVCEGGDGSVVRILRGTAPTLSDDVGDDVKLKWLGINAQFNYVIQQAV